jgi:hypothetical protein
MAYAQVVVGGRGEPTFSISVTPHILPLVPGSTGGFFIVTIGSVDNFGGLVAISIKNSPPGLQFSFPLGTLPNVPAGGHVSLPVEVASDPFAQVPSTIAVTVAGVEIANSVEKDAFLTVSLVRKLTPKAKIFTNQDLEGAFGGHLAGGTAELQGPPNPPNSFNARPLPLFVRFVADGNGTITTLDIVTNTGFQGSTMTYELTGTYIVDPSGTLTISATGESVGIEIHGMLTSGGTTVHCFAEVSIPGLEGGLFDASGVFDKQ